MRRCAVRLRISRMQNSSMPTSTMLLALATPMRLTNSRTAAGGTPRRFNPAIVEFERADRMGDALDRIRLPVGIIIARIDRPFIPGAGMGGVEDAIEHG